MCERERERERERSKVFKIVVEAVSGRPREQNIPISVDAGVPFRVIYI